MSDQPDMLDAAVLFRRIRNWSPSGLGWMTGADMLHQMGGRPGVDPYGWREGRIRAAMGVLENEGSIQDCGGMAGAMCVTVRGMARYDSAESAAIKPALESRGLV